MENGGFLSVAARRGDYSGCSAVGLAKHSQNIVVGGLDDVAWYLAVQRQPVRTGADRTPLDAFPHPYWWFVFSDQLGAGNTRCLGSPS